MLERSHAHGQEKAETAVSKEGGPGTKGKVRRGSISRQIGRASSSVPVLQAMSPYEAVCSADALPIEFPLDWMFDAIYQTQHFATETHAKEWRSMAHLDATADIIKVSICAP